MDPNNFEMVDYENRNLEEQDDFPEPTPNANFEVVDEIQDFNE